MGQNPYAMMQQLQHYWQQGKDSSPAEDAANPDIGHLGMQQQLLEQFQKTVQNNEAAAAAAAVAQLTSGPQQILNAQSMMEYGKGLAAAAAAPSSTQD